MAYHKIYESFYWLGGHADGEEDFLGVAEREIREETGLQKFALTKPRIVMLNTMVVCQHEKRGQKIAGHVHLDIVHVFVADESQEIRIKPDENARVEWIPVDQIDKLVAAREMRDVAHRTLARIAELKQDRKGNICVEPEPDQRER